MEQSEEADSEARKEQIAVRLRALQKPSWRFVVIDDDSVGAFVTSLLPGFVFVHRGLLKLHEGKTEQASPRRHAH
eukprot:6513445-Prymnesium_polylepis.1